MQIVVGLLLGFSLAAAQTAEPQRARELMAEGVRLIREDNLTEAEDRFRKALAAEPNNADAIGEWQCEPQSFD